MSLQDKINRIKQGKSSIIGEKEKGELNAAYGEILTVNDYDFFQGENGEYLVFTTNEYPEHFFFGGQVATDTFRKFDDSDKEEIKAEGVQVKFGETKNKKGNRIYQTIEFI